MQVPIPLPVHNIELGRKYNTISAAVSEARPSDNITVDSGTYYETVQISTPITLRGIDTGSGYPVIDGMGGMGSGIPLTLYDDRIVLDKFNVTNSGAEQPGLIIYSDFNTVTNINAVGNGGGPGIYLGGGDGAYSDNNTISDVHAADNLMCGVWLNYANNNTITNVISDSNGSNGISIENGDSNQILDSTITDNTDFGISLNGATNTLIQGNTIEYNGVKGIYLASSSTNTISDNTIEGNGEYGIYLASSSSNTLSSNTIENNVDYGIYLISSSYSNTIYNNQFNNTDNIYEEFVEGTNFWNITITAGTNIIGRSWMGGNYWAQPDGKGFSQLYGDITGDYIADTPYSHYDTGTDYHPLTQNILPTTVSTHTPSEQGWKFRGDLQNTGVYDDGGIRPDGNERWSNITETGGSGSYILSSPAVVDGVVYISDVMWGGTLYAFDADTGVKLWDIPSISGQSSPAVVGGVVYIGSEYYEYGVYAIDAGNHTIRWRFPTDCGVSSSPAVVDEVVYITDDCGDTFFALNASTGKQLWSIPDISGQSSPAVANGVVYVGSSDYNVTAFNAGTGVKQWNFTTGGYVSSSPAVSNGVVYVGSEDGYVYALNATTGEENIWDSPFYTGYEIYSSPAVANGVVYVGSDWNVYALNANTGAKLWDFPTGNSVSSSPAVSNGVVYIIDESGGLTLYALDAATGVKLWDFAGIEGQSSPAVSNGVVYVGSNDGKLYAIGTAPPLANFTATPTSGTASLPVQFNDTSAGYPATWSWSFGDGTPASAERNPVHTYTSAGTYSVTLTVLNRYGTDSEVRSGYITVQSSGGGGNDGGGGSGGGGGGGGGPPVFVEQPGQEPEQPPEPPALLTPEEQPVEGLAGVTFTQSYPVGFEGLSFNADGQNSLSLDLSAAEQAGATVTTFFDRVEVYQHGSPGVRITFFFDNYNQTEKFITGTAKGAEFETDPLTINVSAGKVAGSVHAVLTSISQPVKVENSITGNITAGNLERFRTVMAQNNLAVAGIAYLMDFQRGKLTSTGAANVTLTVPASWVDQHGGKDAVRITRISDTTGTTELINTVYTGADSGGNMVFRGDSPAGTSIFGLLTAKATTAKQMEEPNVTIQPLQKPALITEIGMFAWLLGMLKDNPVVIVVIIAVIGVVLYVTWKKRQV